MEWPAATLLLPCTPLSQSSSSCAVSNAVAAAIQAQPTTLQVQPTVTLPQQVAASQQCYTPTLPSQSCPHPSAYEGAQLPQHEASRRNTAAVTAAVSMMAAERAIIAAANARLHAELASFRATPSNSNPLAYSSLPIKTQSRSSHESFNPLTLSSYLEQANISSRSSGQPFWQPAVQGLPPPANLPYVSFPSRFVSTHLHEERDPSPTPRLGAPVFQSVQQDHSHPIKSHSHPSCGIATNYRDSNLQQSPEEDSLVWHAVDNVSSLFGMNEFIPQSSTSGQTPTDDFVLSHGHPIPSQNRASNETTNVLRCDNPPSHNEDDITCAEQTILHVSSSERSKLEKPRRNSLLPNAPITNTYSRSSYTPPRSHCLEMPNAEMKRISVSAPPPCQESTYVCSNAVSCEQAVSIKRSEQVKGGVQSPMQSMVTPSESHLLSNDQVRRRRARERANARRPPRRNISGTDTDTTMTQSAAASRGSSPAVPPETVYKNVINPNSTSQANIERACNVTHQNSYLNSCFWSGTKMAARDVPCKGAVAQRGDGEKNRENNLAPKQIRNAESFCASTYTRANDKYRRTIAREANASNASQATTSVSGQSEAHTSDVNSASSPKDHTNLNLSMRATSRCDDDGEASRLRKKKRGRRPIYETEEERDAVRALRNRASASRHRERSRIKDAELERQIVILQLEHDNLNKWYATLSSMVSNYSKVTEF